MTLRFLLNHSLIQKVMMEWGFGEAVVRAKEVDCSALPLSMTLNHQILLACNVSIVHLKPPPQNSDPCKESTNWMVYKVSQWCVSFGPERFSRGPDSLTVEDLINLEGDARPWRAGWGGLNCPFYSLFVLSDSPIITKHNNYSPITKYKDDKSHILKSPKHQLGEVPTSSPFTFSGDSTTSQLPGLAGTTVETLVFGLSASGLSPGQVVFVETCHIFPPQAPDSNTSFCIDPVDPVWCRKRRRAIENEKANIHEKSSWVLRSLQE